MDTETENVEVTGEEKRTGTSASTRRRAVVSLKRECQYLAKVHGYEILVKYCAPNFKRPSYYIGAFGPLSNHYIKKTPRGLKEKKDWIVEATLFRDPEAYLNKRKSLPASTKTEDADQPEASTSTDTTILTAPIKKAVRKCVERKKQIYRKKSFNNCPSQPKE